MYSQLFRGTGTENDINICRVRDHTRVHKTLPVILLRGMYLIELIWRMRKVRESKVKHKTADHKVYKLQE